MGSVLVAYSGGTDSTLLATLAHRVLGNRMIAVFSSSELIPASDREEAISLARSIGFPLKIIEGTQINNPLFTANSPERCYYCRQELFTSLKQVANSEGMAWIADGTNCDDMLDYRPGTRAAREAGIRSPFVEAGLGKTEIRQISRDMSLPTWDKPASPCLASRIQYGIPVLPVILEKIEKGEELLHNLGFKQLRLRHHGDIARIEILPEDLDKVSNPKTREEIVKFIKSLGYKYVTVDLEGFRSGSLNEMLKTSN